MLEGELQIESEDEMMNLFEKKITKLNMDDVKSQEDEAEEVISIGKKNVFKQSTMNQSKVTTKNTM